jgi:hypothetical protein
MPDRFELEAAYWLDLVGKTCDELEVEDALDRHEVALDGARWIQNTTTVTLPECGVRLLLVQASEKPRGAFVAGVEFAVSGLPDGGSYDGSLPHGIDAADTLMDISQKVHPAMPTPGSAPNSFDAVFPEYRLTIQMDEDDILQSVTLTSTRQ